MCNQCRQQELEINPEFEPILHNEYELNPEVGFELLNETPTNPVRTDRPYITWVQKILNFIQGGSLSTDGVMGTNTKTAISRFQGQNGLPVTGVVDSKTEAVLISVANGPVNRSSPNYIKWLQRALRDADSYQVSESGKLTSYTIRSLNYFQRKWGLPVTTVPNEQTDIKLILKGATCCPPKQ